MTSPDLFLTADASPAGREQFRMCQLQVFNWGTFSGLHTVPIAEDGFLFIGRSGSGKSTLLDALASLLIPPKWIDFNAAARETDRSSRDRNLLSYVRGAWAQQKEDESGDIATQYLRRGSTWSAIAVSYRNALGKVVVLVQMFWVKGATNKNTDVKRHHLIFERPFDLHEIQDEQFDIRTVKRKFSEAFAHEDFKPYSDRFSRMLGIENDMALRLLHKTQSAKNLGDLNTFLRDFMLDKPDTFEVAARLVNEFSELNEAHQAVVTAREQVQTLVPARAAHEQLQHHLQTKAVLEELRNSIDGYQEQRRMALLRERIAELTVHSEGLEGAVTQQYLLVENHKKELEYRQALHRELGGEQLTQWEAEKRDKEEQRQKRLQKRGQVQTACRILEYAVPDTPQEFAVLTSNARQEVEDWEQLGRDARDEDRNLDRQMKSAEEAFTIVVQEIRALERQPSNIPAKKLDLRQKIAATLALPESSLPFVGELLDVIPQEQSWRGVIERVLYGFARSLLVDERNYSVLSSYLNEVHLGDRLVYHRTTLIDDTTRQKMIVPNSMVSKLIIKDNSSHAWLTAELRRQFDYACVDSVQMLRTVERGVTREGQIRHSRSRHEKNDYHRIDDRREWALGFDNREKLTLFKRQAQELGATIERLHQTIDALAKREKDRNARMLQCQCLINIQWEDIDVGPLSDRIRTLECQLTEARLKNTDLQEANELIRQEEEHLKSAQQTFQRLQIKYEKVCDSRAECQEKLSVVLARTEGVMLGEEQRLALDGRFAALNESVTLEHLDRLTRLVDRALGQEVETLNRGIGQCERAIEDAFADFKRQWPAAASDVDTTLASAPDFFAKLQRLETDNLPKYETRFLDLLQKQSDQNLADLSARLTQARKAIFERMDLVNASLNQAPFNPGTYLCIEISDRQLPDVQAFRAELKQALTHAWADDRALMEARFGVLQRLVQRLGSQEPEQRRWREAVLDVRQHVEFIGREIDEAGRDVEVYRSGAGKSGGQRQKLATTCLAAALRYQLGTNDNSVPMYAAVVLDEAFDKADNEFTKLAMDIFVQFGFQMIVATPLKSVMTLEPFIGGACFVDITDRRHSGVLLIEYDHASQRLRLPAQVQTPAYEDDTGAVS